TRTHPFHPSHHTHPNPPPYPRQNLQPALESPTAIGGEGSSIGLVIRCLEDKRKLQGTGHGGEAFGHAQRVTFALDHAGAGNQKERMALAQGQLADMDEVGHEGRDFKWQMANCKWKK